MSRIGNKPPSSKGSVAKPARASADRVPGSPSKRSATGAGRSDRKPAAPRVVAGAPHGSAGRIATPGDAARLVELAWPLIVEECRAVLGGELHYQAVVYHCLRRAGAPSAQLGMNVKQWIANCVSPTFRARDLRKEPGFQGGFEPIPDVVLFSPGIRGDWRRRNFEATLRHMLMAIEVKASERAKGRLRAREVIADMEKLAAHQLETEHRGGHMCSAMMVIDTALLETERMTPQARAAIAETALRLGVRLYYVSPHEAIAV